MTVVSVTQMVVVEDKQNIQLQEGDVLVHNTTGTSITLYKYLPQTIENEWVVKPRWECNVHNMVTGRQIDTVLHDAYLLRCVASHGFNITRQVSLELEEECD